MQRISVTAYTPDNPAPYPAVERVLERIASEGFSVVKSCQAEGIDQRTLHRLVTGNSELSRRYAQAREEGLDAMAESLVDDAEAATPLDWQVVRLRIDTKKWLLSKLAPKRYGDKLEVTGKDGGPLEMVHTLIEGRIRAAQRVTECEALEELPE